MHTNRTNTKRVRIFFESVYHIIGIILIHYQLSVYMYTTYYIMMVKVLSIIMVICNNFTLLVYVVYIYVVVLKLHTKPKTFSYFICITREVVYTHNIFFINFISLPLLIKSSIIIYSSITTLMLFTTGSKIIILYERVRI